MNIYHLAECPITERDSLWEKNFRAQIHHARFRIVQEEPQMGPDGWPYLLVEIDKDASETLDKILLWLFNKGIGLVVNPQKDAPDYVFTYGMLWNFRENGEFVSASTLPRLGQIKFEKEQKVFAGLPSSEYLPEYVRQILRAFFSDNGITSPQILVISEDQKNFDLCFSLESLGNPQKQEHQGILEAISWFFPMHYSLVLISETGLPRFHPL